MKQYRELVLVGDAETAAEESVAALVVSVLDSPVGQGEKRERVPVPEGLDREIRRLDTRVLEEDPAKLIELGEALAALLLPPYARRMLAESLARLRPDECLRLRLRLDDRLSDYPWEYAYIAGSLGTLIGADLLNLDKVRGLGAPVASIGGAGKFDGIFLTGIVAVLFAGILGARRHTAPRWGTD